MRKSIFFCEIRHLNGVAEGAYDEAFALLKALGIEVFICMLTKIGAWYSALILHLFFRSDIFLMPFMFSSGV